MLQFFFAAKITHVLKKGRDTYGGEALALYDVQDFVVFLLKYKIDFWSQIQFCKYFLELISEKDDACHFCGYT